MAVLRKQHKSNFTVIANEVFKSSLSLKARGLLSTMLSLPDNWKFSEKGLQAILPADGQTSVRTAIKELEGGGYLTRTRLRNDKGKVMDWVWTFSDYPQENQTTDGRNMQVTDVPQCDFPNLENPNLDNPNLGNPNLETQRQLNTKQVITEEERKQESNTVRDVRHRHGEYRNVLLSDDDLTKLRQKFPSDWQARIENLSEYMESTGKSYKNHFVTICRWAKADAAKGKGAPPSAARAPQPAQAVPSAEEVMRKYRCPREEAEQLIRENLW